MTKDAIQTGYYWIRLLSKPPNFFSPPDSEPLIAWHEYGNWWPKDHPCSADSPIGFNIEVLSARLKPPQMPHDLPDHVVSVIVSAHRCPMCLGHIEPTYLLYPGVYESLKCRECGYDAKPWIDASRARHEAAHDAREG
jgi:hypothetical protein